MKVKAFGFASAILWTICVIWIIGLAMLGRGFAAFAVLDEFYLGLLDPTFSGLLLGIGIAFIDAFIAGALFAWLYNKFAA